MKIENIQRFKSIARLYSEQAELEHVLADLARSKGTDYSDSVQVIFTKDMVQRVEYFTKSKQITRQLRLAISEDYSRIDILWRICNFIYSNVQFDKLLNTEKIDLAVRASLAISAEGVSSTPEEGFLGIEEVPDGDIVFLKLKVHSPIRGAGGTIQGVMTIIVDWFRIKMGYDKYVATEQEVCRITNQVLEFSVMHPRQRMPTSEQIELIVRSCPIFLDALPSEEREVSCYRFLPRIKTPRLRGGLCLVITEGLLLKCKKLQSYVTRFDLELEWAWLKKLYPKATKSHDIEERDEKLVSEAVEEDAPTYLSKIISGRPVISLSKSPGNLRVRIGKSYNTGIGQIGLHPSTCHVFKFLNTGTQLKTEFPGKAASVAPVTGIAPSTVLLKDGSVVRLDCLKYTETVRSEIIKIVDSGEVLITAGDFIQNKAEIPDLGICDQAYLYECQDLGITPDLHVKDEQKVVSDSILRRISLPPLCMPLTHALRSEEFLHLQECYRQNGLSLSSSCRALVQLMAITHTVDQLSGAIIPEFPLVFEQIMCSDAPLIKINQRVYEYLSLNCKCRIRRKGEFTWGARVGRVEGSSPSKTDPSVNWLLFHNKIPDGVNTVKKLLESSAPAQYLMNHVVFKCPACQKVSVHPLHCGVRGVQVARDKTTNGFVDKYQNTDLTPTAFSNFTEPVLIDLPEKINHSLANMGIILDTPVKIGANTYARTLFLESFYKGYLRSKYNVYTIKDGTVRYTCSNAVLTHFSARMVNSTVEKLKQLGYSHDEVGQVLVSSDQIVEMFPQDIVIPLNCADYLLNTTRYIDDLLNMEYGLPSHYNCKTVCDMIGQYCIGVSPHTCVGVLSRIIGLSDTNVLMAHPAFHSAKRRNADGDGDNILLYLDSLLNFSYVFLKQGLGQKMNVPIFLSDFIDLSEVDSECHHVEICNSYDKILYSERDTPCKAADVLKYRSILSVEYAQKPSRCSIHTDVLQLPSKANAYKDLESMEEKINAQIEISQLISNCNTTDLVDNLVNSHLLMDIKGNINTFLRQTLKCKNCGTKFDMATLSGDCTSCGGPLHQTVYANSVMKYRHLVQKLSRRFKLKNYTLSKINLLFNELDVIFGKTKQNTLDDLFY